MSRYLGLLGTYKPAFYILKNASVCLVLTQPIQGFPKYITHVILQMKEGQILFLKYCFHDRGLALPGNLVNGTHSK